MLKDIEECVRRANKMTSTNAEDYLLMSQELSGYYYYLAELKAKTLKAYLDSEAYRKFELKTKTLDYISGGMGVGKGEAQAEIDTFDKKLEENAARANYEQIKSVYEVVKNIITVMQQRVKLATEEMRNQI